MAYKMQIVIEKMESFRKKYPLWSTLFIRIDDLCFPDLEWRDATSSVLCIWIKETHGLLSGAVDRVMLPFMDGDYSISLRLLGKGITFAQYIGPKNAIIHEQEIDLGYFVRQLLSAVGRLEKEYACYRKESQLSELIELAQNLRKISK